MEPGNKWDERMKEWERVVSERGNQGGRGKGRVKEGLGGVGGKEGR